MGWNYVSIHELCDGCNYLSMLGLKWMHIRKDSLCPISIFPCKVTARNLFKVRVPLGKDQKETITNIPFVSWQLFCLFTFIFHSLLVPVLKCCISNNKALLFCYDIFIIVFFSLGPRSPPVRIRPVDVPSSIINHLLWPRRMINKKRICQRLICCFRILQSNPIVAL